MSNAVHLTPTITLFKRAYWKARPWTSYTHQHAPTEGFIHHSADKTAEYMDTLAEQAAVVRSFQRYHMDFHGWSDIGYHFVVFQPYGHRKYARIFQGRPVNHVPAAQLNHNTNTFAICVVGNFDHDDSVKRNTRHAIEVLLKHHRHVNVLGGHRDVVDTDCPGDTLYRQIPTIARAAGLRVYRD